MIDKKREIRNLKGLLEIIDEGIAKDKELATKDLLNRDRHTIALFLYQAKGYLTKHIEILGVD